MPHSKTLGISLGHDSGLAIIEDDRIIFAANEERFTRNKGQSGFPLQSLNYILQNGMLESVNLIAIDGRIVAPHGNDARYRFEVSSPGIQGLAELLKLDSFFLKGKVGVSALRTIFFFLHHRKRGYQNSFIGASLGDTSIPIHRVDHHIAHAASIAFPHDAQSSGLVVTLDGIGEGICSRILRLQDGKLLDIDYTPALGSPALMYGYATNILGYRINRHEGKLTGLAAFGNHEITADIFLKYFRYQRGRLRANRIGYGKSAIKKLQYELKGFKPEDIAAGVQFALEKNVTKWISDVTERTGDSRIFLSGGAFANVKLNQRIAQLPQVNDVLISPNMGDGGLALGAAASIHPVSIKLRSLYLGTQIESGFRTSNAAELVYSGDSFHDLIAKLLSERKIVAIARGHMEYGPRALGNRSILYSAKEREVNQWLNSRLNRTEFMPFAPMCRDLDAFRNFKFDLPIERYRYMTITCDVTDYCKETAPAVVHIDGTARPQIVFKEDNPDIYEILERYSKYVDNPVVVNTSFNMHEEPIVRTEAEALKAFKKSRIDYLLLGNQLYRNT
jgi:carbamoyltransferase